MDEKNYETISSDERIIFLDQNPKNSTRIFYVNNHLMTRNAVMKYPNIL